MRKIIQISFGQSHIDAKRTAGNIVVLCDDGTVWMTSLHQLGAWLEVPNVPQTGANEWKPPALGSPASGM